LTTTFRFKAKATPKAALSSELVTEDQAAIEFVRRYERKLRFFREASLWFEWNGSVWRENLTGLAFHWARELARDLAASEPDRVRYVASKTSFAAGVERFARSDPAFAVTSKDWDRDPMLLGTPGGTVDLRTGVLLPGKPEWGITKSTLCAPADEADCPRWMAFLSEATGGDHELVRFLQQWSGYSLTGDVSEQALIFVHGPGGNGKTVFVNAITSIMGDYSCTAAMDTFTASRGDRHPTELAMLRGARVVTASETEHGRAWAEAKIKQLTGGDAITAHFMRKDDFTFRPTFKLTIIGNHKPRLRNVDDAMQRRVNIIPFVHKPRQADSRLEEKLRNEWPGILRWMLNGCLDWQKN
jgi:putative DNA primase/helicase